ncbi:MAG: hypothetical protein Q9225_001028 [Loekoesia sp. 1 TL-2023]
MAPLAEPMAVVGVGCRFPGGAHDMSSFWQMLADGRSAWSAVPSARFNESAFAHAGRGSTAAYRHIGGHFLDEDIAAFDAAFFGISTSEAEAMDPQQRIQLEVAYEAVENAGILGTALQGSSTGVYVATFTHDYENMMYQDPITIPKYSMTGLGQAIVANRISYAFDLKGPSMTLDTACSGSLVALHQACQSLRLRETSMALVGGTNLILSPDTMIPMDKLGILNPQGRCFSFDVRGSGYGRGEGVAMVVVKRLDDALKAGDAIRAVIRSSAVGQDGRTKTITLPDGAAQRSLMKTAYEVAGLDPSETSYVEAHGTGTIAGDLTEIEAIGKSLRGRTVSGHRPKRALYVGSVKANIGHLESTSGLAGLIKAILIIEKGLIPPVANLRKVKQDLDLLNWGIENSFGYGGTNAHAVLESVPAWRQSVKKNTFPPYPQVLSSEDWSGQDNSGQNDGRACQSSWTNGQFMSDKFEGFDFPTDVANSPRDDSNRFPKAPEHTAYLCLVTSNSEKSLKQTVQKLQSWALAREDSDTYLPDLAFTLNTRRNLLPWRYAFVSGNHQDTVAALHPSVTRAKKVAKNHRVIYIFNGQGAQRPGMARELLGYPSFHSSIEESGKILRRLGANWDLYEELIRDDNTSKLQDSEYGQPATTAVQIALVTLLRLIGICPTAVLGHSSGEIGAAYAAGSLSHTAAIEVSYFRGFLAGQSQRLLQKKGAMLAVGIGEKETRTHIASLKGLTDRIGIACVNSPTSTTISGDNDAIIELESSLSIMGIASIRLKVDAAYHSYHMEAVADSYLEKLQTMTHTNTDSSIRFYSSVTAKEKTSDFGAAYWVSNLVSTVRFSDALEVIHRQMVCEGSLSTSYTLVEVGSHGALLRPINQTITKLQDEHTMTGVLSIDSVATLTRDCNSQPALLESVGLLLEHGYPVNLEALYGLYERPRPYLVTDLPPYSWDHTYSYWHQSRLTREHLFRKQPFHDLLGFRQVGVLEPTWRHVLNAEQLPWLQDHAINDSIVFPASGYIVMAIEAKKQITLERSPECDIMEYMLREVVLANFLNIPHPPNSVETQITLRLHVGAADRTSTGWEEFQISSVSASGAVTEHCHGLIKVKSVDLMANKTLARDDTNLPRGSGSTEYKLLQNLQDNAHTKVPIKDFYDRLKSNGSYWGPSFALITSFCVGQYGSIGKVRIYDIVRSTPDGRVRPHTIHPTTLDALMHTGLINYTRTTDSGGVFPVGIGEVIISANVVSTPEEQLTVATTLVSQEVSRATVNVAAFQGGQSPDLQLCALIKNVKLRRMSPTQLSGKRNSDQQTDLYQIEWGLDVDHCVWPSEHLKQKSLDFETCKQQERKLRSLNEATLKYILACSERTSAVEVKPQFLKYWNWMTELSKREKTLISSRQDETYESKINHEHIEGEVLSRVGSNLAPILTGRVDPLSMLLEGDLLSRFYAQDVASHQCYTHMAEFVRHLAFKQQLRVLEVGAGTAGATLPLLKALDSCEGLPLLHYDFTDVSSGFFDEARQSTDKWKDLISFKALDISRDPIEQGFIEADYDLILASNALHTTINVDTAISNVRKLLKIGGRLILIEITQLAPFVTAIFGLLSGWFLERNDGRHSLPILSCEQWQDRLLAGSFSGVDFKASDFDGPAHMMSVLVSRAVPVQQPIVARDLITISFDPENTNGYSSIAQMLSKRLQDEGFPVLVMQTIKTKLSSGSTNIILGYGDRPMLSNSDLADGLQTLSSDETNVLWVLRVHSAADHLSGGFRKSKGIADQFCPTIGQPRMVKFILSDDSPQRSLAGRLYDVLYSAYLAPRTQRSHESHYLYHHGGLLIPRVRSHGSCMIGQLQDCKPETQQEIFHKPDTSLVPDRDSPSSPKDPYSTETMVMGSLLKSNEIEVQVEAYEVGRARQTLELGVRKVTAFAGIITNVGSNANQSYLAGDKVCCWTTLPLANRIRVRTTDLCKLPDGMPMDFGATIPLTFTTASYALFHIAHLQKGHKLLVHSAAEPIGKAALQLAVYVGADVLVTVFTVEQRLELAGGNKLPEDYVLLKGENSLETAVRKFTGGLGLDAVLDLMPDGSIGDGTGYLKHFGAYITVDEQGISARNAMRTNLANRNAVITSIDPGMLLQHRPEQAQKISREVIRLYKEQKITSQLAEHVPSPEVRTAFKKVQDTQEKGNIHMKTFNDIKESSKQIWNKKAIISEIETYLIVGNSDSWNDDVCCLLTDRGARNVLVLNWGNDSQSENEWKNSSVHIISRNVSDNSSIKEVLERDLKQLPPVKAINPVEVPSRRLLDLLGASINSPDMRLSVTLSILDDPWQALDHVIDLSLSTNIMTRLQSKDSVSDILGHQETSLQDRCANSIVIDAWCDETPQAKSDVLFTLEHALSADMQEFRQQSYLAGFNIDAVERQGYNALSKLPILSLTPLSAEQKSISLADAPRPGIQTITNAQTFDEALQIVVSAVRLRIFTYVAVESDMIDDAHTPIEDFGLDSLMRFEFRDWIYRTFHASVETHELSGAHSISSLASIILSRTDLLAHLELGGSDSKTYKQKTELESQKANPYKNSAMGFDQYPPQPLIPLDQTLQAFLDVAHTFCTDTEMDRIRSAAAKFEGSPGLGPQLHERLAEKAQDPAVENWLSFFYTERRYLRQRTSLMNGQIYFGTHPPGNQPHKQAERAALITLTVLDFKHELDSGKLEPHTVSGQTMDLRSQRWLFNTCREPQRDEDVVNVHSVEEYVVVLRYGQAFKIEVHGLIGNTGFHSLELAFQKILEDTPKTTEGVGLLTADDRDKWANFRSVLIESSETNKTAIQIIEAAAFLICLDEASPTTAKERCSQFLLVNESDNRWYDKTLQFIICSNGVSATLCEHSCLDGITIEPIQKAINKAIESHTTRSSPDADTVICAPIEKLHISIPQAIKDHIPVLRNSLNSIMSSYTFTTLHTSALTAAFFRKHRCPTQSGIQMAMQLGLRRFFGYAVPACEPVSLAHFRQGRVEVHHIIQPAVARFIDSAIASHRLSSESVELKKLFYEAAAAHAKSLTRCSAGKGFSRHLLAMEWMLADMRKERRESSNGDGDDLEDPEFFQDDVYQRLKPGKIMTSCFNTGWLEGGFFYPVPGGVLIYFEIRDEEVRFSIFGNEVDADAIRGSLITAFAEVRALLDENDNGGILEE